VEIRPEWAVKEQIPFASLLKLSCQVGEPETLHECGTLEYYDKTFDKVGFPGALCLKTGRVKSEEGGGGALLTVLQN
jgi:hypothetical protein